MTTTLALLALILAAAGYGYWSRRKRKANLGHAWDDDWLDESSDAELRDLARDLNTHLESLGKRDKAKNPDLVEALGGGIDRIAQLLEWRYDHPEPEPEPEPVAGPDEAAPADLGEPVTDDSSDLPSADEIARALKVLARIRDPKK